MSRQRSISWGADIELTQSPIQSPIEDRSPWVLQTNLQIPQTPEEIQANDKRIYHCNYSGAAPMKKKVNIDGFLKLEPLKMGGTHIFYLPSVEHALSTGPGRDSTLQHHLINKFHVPSFFFERMGWDSNGFHLSSPNPVRDYKGTSIAHTMRFLAKEVAFEEDYNPQKELINYQWRFMAFHLLRLKPRGGSQGCLVLLCFDLLEPHRTSDEDRSVTSFEKFFNMTATSPSDEDEYDMLGNLLEHVVSRYDSALWTYRKPVRAMEKANDKFIEKLWRTKTTANGAPLSPTDTVVSLSPQNSSVAEKGQVMQFVVPRPPSRTMSMDEIEIEKHRQRLSAETGLSEARYRYIHDLTRHIVHIAECLAVGSNTLTSIATNFDSSEQVGSANSILRFKGRLTFLRMTLENLQHRAKAFEARLHSESRMASHIAEEKAAQTSREILDQSRQLLQRASNDGRELNHFVSALSILFLPPTFTSGFFGMQFFSLPMEYIWIWFVVTIPLLIIATWAWQNVRRLTRWAKRIKKVLKTVLGIKEQQPITKND